MAQFDRNSIRLQQERGSVYANVVREDGDLLPEGSMRNPKVITNGMVLKNPRIQLRNPTVPAVFFPSLDPHRQFEEYFPSQKQKESDVEEVEVIDESPTFIQVQRRETPEDIFADMGLIVDDEDAVDATEEQDNTEVSLKDANAPNFSTPEEMFEILASKTIKNFEMTKDDFNALKFTKGQIRKLYSSVTGKSHNNQEIVTLKKEIRKVANQSIANYKRVLNEIKTIRAEK